MTTFTSGPHQLLNEAFIDALDSASDYIDTVQRARLASGAVKAGAARQVETARAALDALLEDLTEDEQRVVHARVVRGLRSKSEYAC